MAAPGSHHGLTLAEIRAIYGIPANAHDSAFGRMDSKTRNAARSRKLTDFCGVSKPKLHYRRHNGELLPSAVCICAISTNCPCKPPGEQDCRSLVPAPKPSHDSAWGHIGPLINTHISKDMHEIILTVQYFEKLALRLQDGHADFPDIHQHIRKWLSDMRCFSIDEKILTLSHILEIFSSFSRWIVKNNISYRRVPEDIRADVVWLKSRWQMGDWNLADPLRGLNIAYKNDCISRSLNKNWKFYNPAWNRFGHNGLVPGVTWRYYIAIMRDGGHGSPEAGISGIAGQGAVSVVLSVPNTQGEYADWDEGNKIGYVSTVGSRDQPSTYTQFLLDSHDWYVKSNKIKIEGEDQQTEEERKKEDRPVRVFRSWKLPTKNTWRPKNGFRYDGLYDVIDKELINPGRALYRFTMERQYDQWAIRVDQPDDQTLLLWDQCAITQKTAK